MKADEITAYAAVATAVATFLAVGVAWFQLRGIKLGLNMSTLMAVLEIETQMNERKVHFDRCSADVRQAALEGRSPDAMAILESLFKSAKENYFNALDRLCFCIAKEYIKDKDWRTEYRAAIHNVIVEFEVDFGPASPFRNIKAIDAKWQSS